MEVAYFLAGALTMYMSLFIFKWESKKELRKKGTWSSITKIDYNFNTDYKLPYTMNAQEILYAMAEVFKVRIESDCSHFQSKKIKPSFYKIDCFITVNFTERETNEEVQNHLE